MFDLLSVISEQRAIVLDIQVRRKRISSLQKYVVLLLFFSHNSIILNNGCFKKNVVSVEIYSLSIFDFTAPCNERKWPFTFN